MSKVTSMICGTKRNHEHNNDWSSVETFEGGYYTGPTNKIYELVKQRGERIQMDSVACSICGSSAFGRDVYYGLE